MRKLTDLFGTEEFVTGSYQAKRQLFNDWVSNDFMQLTASLDEESRNKEIEKATKFFNQYNPEPESDWLSDATDSMQASVGTLTQLGAETARNLVPNIQGFQLANQAAIATGQKPLTDRLNETVNAVSKAGGELRQEQLGQLSDYAKDKQLELSQALEGVEDDLERAKIYTNFMVNNPSQLGLVTLESFAPTVAGLIPAVRAAKVGGIASGLATGAGADFILGGAEGALGARETIKHELMKAGVREDLATKIADEESQKAFLPSGAVSAAISPVSELLPAVKVFGKKVPTTKSKKRRLGESLTAGGVGIAGEGAQGGLVQQQQNIAVNDLVPTESGKGVFEAAAQEALGAAPVSGSFTGIDVAGIAFGKNTIVDPNEPTPSTEEILDAGDALVNQSPEAQDTEIFEDAIKQSGINSTDSFTFDQGQEDPARIIGRSDRGRLDKIEGSDTGDAQTLSDPVQQASPGTPVTQTPEGQISTEQGQADQLPPNGPTVGRQVEQAGGVADNQGTERGTGQDPTGDNRQTEVVTPENMWIDLVEEEGQTLDINYADLSPELKTRWNEAVEDNFASASLGDEIISIHKNNIRKTGGQEPNKTIDSKLINELPENYADIIRGKVTATDQDNINIQSIIGNTGIPVSIDSSAKPREIQDIDSTEVVEFSGALGAVNANARSEAKGSYLIADQKNNTIHLMSKAGKKVKSAPFTSKNISSPSTQVKIGGSRVGSVKAYNVRTSGQKKKNNDFTQRGPVIVPNSLDDEISKNNFSGDLFVVSDDAVIEETDITTPIPDYERTGSDTAFDALPEGDSTDIQVRMFLNPISKETIAKLKTKKSIDADMMDVLIAEAKKQNSDFFTRIFKKLKPHLNDIEFRIEDLSKGHGGYYNWVKDELVIANNKNGFNLHTIAHEMTHAATVHAIQGGSSRVNKIADNLWKDFQNAIEVFPTNKVYAFTNIYEFIAEIYTNQDFRNELNKIVHSEDKTFWDNIKDNTFGIFNIKPMYTPDGTIELTELMFESSRQLQNVNVAPIGQRGATNWNDDLYDQDISDTLQPFESRRLMSHRAFKARMEIRHALVDNTARFLAELNLNTNITKNQAEFDEAPVYMALKAITSKSQRTAQAFQSDQIREIETASRALYDDFKDSGLSYVQVRDLAAHYATANHIETATQAAYKRFTNKRDELIETLEVINEQLGKLEQERAKSNSSEPTPQEVRLLQDRNQAEIDLSAINRDIREFNYAQENKGLGLDNYGLPTRKPTTLIAAIQGGMTILDSKEAMRKYSAKLSGDITQPEGTPESIKRLDEITQLYINAYADVRNYLHDNNEIFDSEIVEWEELGLNKDFISFQGLDPEGEDVNTSSAFGASRLSDASDFRRRGRRSKPDNAWVNLHKAVDTASRKVASRPFRARLLGHIQNGDFDKTGAQWTSNKHNATFKKADPKGFKPIQMKSVVNGQEKIYEFWIEDPKVMASIRGVAEEQLGWLGRKVGGLTHAWSAGLTYLVPMFGPVNSFKDVVELTTNTMSRNIRTKDGKKLNKMILARKVARYYMSSELTRDSGKLYKERMFGKDPIQSETLNSYIGKKMQELENLGGLNNVFEHAAQEYSRAIKDDKVSRFFEDQFKKSSKMADGLTPKQLQKAYKQAALKGSDYKNNIFHAIRLWNVMWEVRSKVAMYTALTEMGVDSEVAAFRVRDLLDLSQRGAYTKQMSALYPFFRAILAGSANLQRTMMTPNGWKMMIGASLFYVGIHSALRWLAGDNDEDPEFKYNCMDSLSPMSVRTSIPVFLREEGDTGCGRPVKAPVPYGLHYVANTIATMIHREHSESVVDGTENKILEVIGAYMEETFPSKASIGALESSGAMSNYFINQFVPPWALGVMNNITNTNQFGRPIDYKIGAGATDGRMRTEETYKKWAVDLHDLTGGFINTSPQKLKTFVESITPGVYEAIRLGVLNESGVKGKEETFRQQMGYFNIVGLSRIYGEEKIPEERLFYQKAYKFTDDRRRLGVRQVKVPRYNKDGSRGKGKRAFKNEWDWTEEQIKEKPGLKEKSDLADTYFKKMRKISSRANKIYNEVKAKQRKDRLLSNEPDLTYVKEIERLRKPAVQEEFFELRTEARTIMRDFIKEINKMENPDANN